MDKTYYTVFHTHSNALKNNLHKAFEEQIIFLDRKVSTDLTALKKLIKDAIVVLNKKYSRCKPIELCFSDFMKNEKKISIHTNTGIHALILEFKTID